MIEHPHHDTLPATSAVALAATLGLAAACWPVAIRQMRGMDMGVATELGTFAAFLGLWIAMMAAMMLPGAAAAIARVGPTAVPRFLGSYLAVWTLVGIAAYVLYRPHGTALAGALVTAAGGYELTPLKRRFRRRCRENIRSGSAYGLCCVGSSIGLMLILLALGVMSVGWMTLIALVVVAQKAVAPKPVLDIPLALAIVGYGVAIVLAPASAGWL